MTDQKEVKLIESNDKWITHWYCDVPEMDEGFIVEEDSWEYKIPLPVRSIYKIRKPEIDDLNTR